MTDPETLRDVQTREAQLRLHILRSEDYARRFQKEFNRRVFLVYLSIVLLLAFQTIYAWGFGADLQTAHLAMILVTSALAIANCFLLIRTRGWLRRVNERWIAPQEKVALESLRTQRHQMQDADDRASADYFQI